MIGWLFKGLRTRRLTTALPRPPEESPRRASGAAPSSAERQSTATPATALAEACLPGALDGDRRRRLAPRRLALHQLRALPAERPTARLARARSRATSSRTATGRITCRRGEARLPQPQRQRRERATDPTGLRTDPSAARSTSATSTPAPTAPSSRRSPRCSTPTTTCSASASSSPRRRATPTSCWSPGPVTAPMEEHLRRTYEAMPEPRIVVAAGTDACSGGIWSGPETLGGVDQVLPVDVYIPGDPPAPITLLHGLLLATGRVCRRAAPPLAEEAHGMSALGLLLALGCAGLLVAAARRRRGSRRRRGQLADRDCRRRCGARARGRRRDRHLRHRGSLGVVLRLRTRHGRFHRRSAQRTLPADLRARRPRRCSSRAPRGSQRPGGPSVRRLAAAAGARGGRRLPRRQRLRLPGALGGLGAGDLRPGRRALPGRGGVAAPPT